MNSGEIAAIKLEEGWEAIKQTIDKLVKILESVNKLDDKIVPFTPAEYITVYTKCYNMCTQRSSSNCSKELYLRHGQAIYTYLKSNVLPILKGKRDEFLLKEMVLRWQHHEVMDKWMCKFFMYLDRYYVKHNSVPTLHESSLEKFHTLVFDSICKKFVDAILVQINKERNGEVVDCDLMKRCVAIFVKMADGLVVYKRELEEPLLESTRDFYRKKSLDLVEIDTLPAYLMKAECALEAERERVNNYLDVSTKNKLQNACAQELLQVHETTLLEKEGSGFQCLLANDKKKDIERLYTLYKKVPGGLDPIAAILKEHVMKMGVDIIERREAALAAEGSKTDKDSHDPAFVQSLLDLHDKYERLISDEFGGDVIFHKVLKEAFEYFVNMDKGRSPNAELISNFCDRILKTGGAKLSDDRIEEYLEKCVRLFSYLHDKDLFSEVYRNQLSKRLLLSRSSSNDAEMSMIGKLKLACGAHFTSKFEGMIKDRLTGDDFKKKFKDCVRSTPELIALKNRNVELSAAPSDDLVSINGIEYSVTVLTTGHWPTPKPVCLNLPASLTLCMEVYKKFYDSKTSHRCLNWAPVLGTNVVKAKFKRSYDLQVTTLQAVALLQFNGPVNEWLSFEVIASRLGCDEEVLKRIMHSLSCGKFKVIVKEPVGKRVETSDRFKVNEEFQSSLRKLRIPMVSLQESHNPKIVEEDRSIAIEAAIVRIMKARKRLAHTQLIAEVIQHLIFFKPDPRSVKRRIEHLIDREYLERDEDQPNYYKYLA